MASTASMVTGPRAGSRLPKAIALAVILLVAASFVLKYVFHYLLSFVPATLGDYWPLRLWFAMHICGGTVALLSGPWQFSSRLRKRYLKVHRITGRVYLIAICCGATGAFGMVSTLQGRPLGWMVGLATLAVAWLLTSGTAYYAILKRQIQVHREWMVRSYIVTFAFASFRMLNDFGPLSRVEPENERSTAILWTCWVVPLLVAEVWFALRRVKQAAH